jgi:hypothetical protein
VWKILTEVLTKAELQEIKRCRRGREKILRKFFGFEKGNKRLNSIQIGEQ